MTVFPGTPSCPWSAVAKGALSGDCRISKVGSNSEIGLEVFEHMIAKKRRGRTCESSKDRELASLLDWPQK